MSPVNQCGPNRPHVFQNDNASWFYLVKGQEGNGSWRSIGDELTMNGIIKGSLDLGSE